MSQLLILHRDDIRPHALKAYAYLRKQFPNATIVPNVHGLLNNNQGIGQGMFKTQVVLVMPSADWHSGWLYNEDDPDTIALKAALMTKKTLFVLQEDGVPLPDDLPEHLQTLRGAMRLNYSSDALYATLDTLSTYLQPLLATQQPPSGMQQYPQSGMPTNTIKYPPNPRYPGSDRIIHKAISPIAFQHPLDRMATESLRQAKGFDYVVKKFMEFGIERVQQVLYAASSVKVSSNQYPKLYKMLEEASAILDMPMPDMYVLLGDQVNAFTFGHTKPYIVIFSPLLDMMSDDEILAVIAHELGHIKCSHVLYNQMAMFAAPLISDVVGSIPLFGDLGKVAFDVSIQVALLAWSRRSELSADRAALLVMQDPMPCISLLAKFAGGSVHLQDELNLEAFIEQAKAYEISEETGNVDKFYRFWAFMNQTTHPFPVERARFLNDWIDSVEYDQIMDGAYERIPPIQ